MELKIGGHQYKLVIEKIKDDLLGECDYDQAKITISPDITVQSIREATLLHEILHACNSTFGSEGVEHGLLDSLSEQLYQVLKDNDLLNHKTFKKLLTGVHLRKTPNEEY